MDRPCNRLADEAPDEDDNVYPTKEATKFSLQWWKTKKANFTFHKELVPLKIAIMLFYGGKCLSPTLNSWLLIV